MKELNVKIEGDTKTLTVLTGQALTPREPEMVDIEGNIFAPRLYLEKRTPIKENDTIIYSRSKMSITYRKNEMDQLGARVTGKIQLNPDLEKFFINHSTKMWQLQELAKTIKMNKVFFADKEKVDTLVASLLAFKGTITTDIEKANDGRGNSKDLTDRKTTGNMPTDFALELPVFVGGTKKKFRVEIGVDSTDASVKFWLESSELQQIIIEDRDKMIDSEITAIKAICEMPCIEQV